MAFCDYVIVFSEDSPVSRTYFIDRHGIDVLVSVANFLAGFESIILDFSKTDFGVGETTDLELRGVFGRVPLEEEGLLLLLAEVALVLVTGLLVA